jgi:transcriptional regulator with XRE-family HTH domain
MKPHERLKKARLHLGLTQREMAGRLNIKPSTYSQLENGHHGFAAHIYYALRTSLRINDEYIREGTGEMLLPIPKPEPRPSDAIPVIITEEDFGDIDILKKKVRQLEGFVDYLLPELNRYRKIVDMFLNRESPTGNKASQD